MRVIDVSIDGLIAATPSSAYHEDRHQERLPVIVREVAGGSVHVPVEFGDTFIRATHLPTDNLPATSQVLKYRSIRVNADGFITTRLFTGNNWHADPVMVQTTISHCACGPRHVRLQIVNRSCHQGSSGSEQHSGSIIRRHMRPHGHVSRSSGIARSGLDVATRTAPGVRCCRLSLP